MGVSSGQVAGSDCLHGRIKTDGWELPRSCGKTIVFKQFLVKKGFF